MMGEAVDDVEASAAATDHLAAENGAAVLHVAPDPDDHG